MNNTETPTISRCTSHVTTGHDKHVCIREIGHPGNHETDELRWTKRAPITITWRSVRAPHLAVIAR